MFVKSSKKEILKEVSILEFQGFKKVDNSIVPNISIYASGIYGCNMELFIDFEKKIYKLIKHR